MIEGRHLWAGYPDKTVLKDLSFTLPAGEVTAVLGPNGCGKSTLLKVLCGLIPPESGEILVDGDNLRDLSPRERARKIAYLPQSRRVPDITVYGLVLHGRFPYLGYPRRYREADHAAARKALEELDLLPLADTPLEKLSGGQRQKVYLAMALAQDTPAVLLDEPGTYLDVAHRLQLMALARALARRGKAVVMVLHDLDLAFRDADGLILLEGGRIAARGTAEELFASGVADRVFGIRLDRIGEAGNRHYFCRER